LTVANLPTFNSAFLIHLSRRIEARRKAIKHKGNLTWETKQPDDFEWLSVYITPFTGDHCIFQFVEDNRVYIYVRSKRNANRGKILLEIEDITIIDNAHAIVDAIEVTIYRSHALQSEHAQEAVNAIRAVWADLEIRAFKE
jgi:hypothetical protein